MKALDIWVGTEYARTRHPSRGVDYYPNSERVLAVQVFDKVLLGNSKKTTFVKVMFLDPETGDPLKVSQFNPETKLYEKVDWIGEVRAREIFMRWDEYEDERETRRQEQEERDAARRKRDEEARIERERMYAERERIAEEQRKMREAVEEAKQIEREKIKRSLLIRGIPTDGIIVNDSSVTIPIETVKRWLGIRAVA